MSYIDVLELYCVPIWW